MSDKHNNHIGIIQSLIEEFRIHRFPRLLRLKEKVDRGELITEVDLLFLTSVIEDANRTMHMTSNHPELHEFCLHVVHLYKVISEKALENEKDKKSFSASGR